MDVSIILVYSLHLTDYHMRGSRHNKENVGSSFAFPQAQMQLASAAPDSAAEMMKGKMVA
jgi:hypothetical protein